MIAGKEGIGRKSGADTGTDAVDALLFPAVGVGALAEGLFELFVQLLEIACTAGNGQQEDTQQEGGEIFHTIII